MTDRTASISALIGKTAPTSTAPSTYLRTMPARVKAFLTHLVISALVAGVVFTCIYWIWYPPPYFELGSGRSLLYLVIICDLVLGPLLTLAVFNTRKPRKELRRDLAIIGLLQLAGLAYGAHTMFIARPVYVVYNQGQFNLVQAASIDSAAYKLAPPSIPANPLTGPVMVGALMPDDVEVRNKMMFEAVEGGPDLFQRPQYFVPYAQVRDEVAKKALSAGDFVSRHTGNLSYLQGLIDEYARNGKTVKLMPVVTLGRFGVALVEPGGNVLTVQPAEPAEAR